MEIPRYNYLFRLLASGTILFLIFCPKVFSQPSAFDQLYVGLKAVENLYDNQLRERWESYPGAEFNVHTPFYAGRLEAGLRYHRFRHSDEWASYSDFHSTFIYLGWGYLLKINSRFRLGPVLRFGNNYMHFDDPKIYSRPDGFEYDFDDSESEFAYELLLTTEYHFSPRWKLEAGLSYNRTITYQPLQQTMVSVGFSYAFKTSPWLKDFLK